MVETKAGSAGNAGSPVDQEQYKNLEKALGTQGQELGELRQFFTDIAPLLEKLDKSPELVQAIVDGKIDTNLTKAILDGKVKIEDAKIVSAANTEVKKELGTKTYNSTDPKDIEKMVEEKVALIKQELTGSMKEMEDARVFEAQLNDFISRTPDFEQYAAEIDKYLDEHDITDIEVAYYAVKGKLSEKEAKKVAEREAGEAAKNVALNAGGGASRITYSGEGENVVDSLIAGRANPNIFRKN